MIPQFHQKDRRNLERRFHIYCVLKNSRLFDAFFVLFLLFDLNLSYTAVGLVLAYEKILMGVLEVPLAVVADRYGRRTGLSISFAMVTIACIVFAIAPLLTQPMLAVYLGTSIYGIGEALRTGGHKAMVLDWLEMQNERERRIALLASMRFVSKTTTGLTALAAGVLVWQTGRFSILFLLSSIPALSCSLLLRTYPIQLEGVTHRSKHRSHPRSEAWQWSNLGKMMKTGQLWTVLMPSILFESQMKLAQALLQPAIAEGVKGSGFDVTGGFGAVLVGAYLMVSGVLAGSASLLSRSLQLRFGSTIRAVNWVHGISFTTLLLGAISMLWNYPWLSLALLLFTAALQNIRRPLFVTMADDVMASEYRTTGLSVESQMRSWLFAMSALGSGMLADTYGLEAAFGAMAVIVALAWTIGLRRTTA